MCLESLVFLLKVINQSYWFIASKMYSLISGIPACAGIDYPIIIPAIVAESNEAIVPPMRAFIPNSDKVLR